MEYASRDVGVGVVGLTVRDGELACLLQIAKAGAYRLPRGATARGESLAKAAARLLASASGLSSAAIRLEQLGAFEDKARLDIGYLGIAPHVATASSDPQATSWVPVSKVLQGPSDRADVNAADQHLLREAVERTRAQFEQTPIAPAFCPAEFTIGDLRRVYEAVWDTRLDPGNFHRKVTKLPGFLVATGRTAMRTCGRPGQTYEAGPATRLHPPLLRSETV